MLIAEYEVEVIQKVLNLFEKGAAQPFNDWSSAAIGQGFSWREGAVGFLVFEDADPARVRTAFHAADEPVIPDDAERVLQLPFRVSSGVLDVSGIYEAEDRSIPIPPGDYCLTYALAPDPDGSAGDDPRLTATFTFVPGTCPARIVRKDRDLEPDDELAMDGKPA